MANKINFGATIIAKTMVIVGGRGLPPEQLALNKMFLKEALDQNPIWKILERVVSERIFLKYVDLAIPGLSMHYLRRKQLIENTVKHHINNGFRQIIILGAGFDTLAIRLAKESPAINFFEIDRVENVEAKKQALQKNNHSVTANVHFLPGDFEFESLQQIIGSSIYDKTLPTVFVMEGLIMHMPPPAVERLFADMGMLSKAGNKMIFGAMDKGNQQVYSFEINPEEMKSFLNKFGLKLVKQVNYKSLQPEVVFKEAQVENYYFAEKI